MFSIEKVEHKKQRHHKMVGDWIENGPQIKVRVSKFDYEEFEFLVALHEMIEAYLCRRAGITQQAVDEFNVAYNNAEGDEPGDNPRAPFYMQHQQASAIEGIMCALLGISWDAYKETIGKLIRGDKAFK